MVIGRVIEDKSLFCFLTSVTSKPLVFSRGCKGTQQNSRCEWNLFDDNWGTRGEPSHPQKPLSFCCFGPTPLHCHYCSECQMLLCALNNPPRHSPSPDALPLTILFRVLNIPSSKSRSQLIGSDRLYTLHCSLSVDLCFCSKHDFTIVAILAWNGSDFAHTQSLC
jgi:hypothetical protein